MRILKTVILLLLFIVSISFMIVGWFIAVDPLTELMNFEGTYTRWFVFKNMFLQPALGLYVGFVGLFVGLIAWHTSYDV